MTAPGSGLVERLREGARSIVNDGTPSQVGPTADDLCEAVALIGELTEALNLYQRAIGPLTGKPLTDEQWKRLHDCYAIARFALEKAEANV